MNIDLSGGDVVSLVFSVLVLIIFGITKYTASSKDKEADRREAEIDRRLTAVEVPVKEYAAQLAGLHEFKKNISEDLSEVKRFLNRIMEKLEELGRHGKR
jgi:hypothetical protein